MPIGLALAGPLADAHRPAHGAAADERRRHGVSASPASPSPPSVSFRARYSAVEPGTPLILRAPMNENRNWSSGAASFSGSLTTTLPGPRDPGDPAGEVHRAPEPVAAARDRLTRGQRRRAAAGSRRPAASAARERSIASPSSAAGSSLTNITASPIVLTSRTGGLRTSRREVLHPRRRRRRAPRAATFSPRRVKPTRSANADADVARARAASRRGARPRGRPRRRASGAGAASASARAAGPTCGVSIPATAPKRSASSRSLSPGSSAMRIAVWRITTAAWPRPRPSTRVTASMSSSGMPSCRNAARELRALEVRLAEDPLVGGDRRQAHRAAQSRHDLEVDARGLGDLARRVARLRADVALGGHRDRAAPGPGRAGGRPGSRRRRGGSRAARRARVARPGRGPRAAPLLPSQARWRWTLRGRRPLAHGESRTHDRARHRPRPRQHGVRRGGAPRRAPRGARRRLRRDAARHGRRAAPRRDPRAHLRAARRACARRRRARGALLRRQRALGLRGRAGARGRDARRRPARRSRAPATRPSRSRARSAARAARRRTRSGGWCRRCWACAEVPPPDHAADALAVAICHANHAPLALAVAG